MKRFPTPSLSDKPKAAKKKLSAARKAELNRKGNEKVGTGGDMDAFADLAAAAAAQEKADVAQKEEAAAATAVAAKVDEAPVAEVVKESSKPEEVKKEQPPPSAPAAAPAAEAAVAVTAVNSNDVGQDKAAVAASAEDDEDDDSLSPGKLSTDSGVAETNSLPDQTDADSNAGSKSGSQIKLKYDYKEGKNDYLCVLCTSAVCNVRFLSLRQTNGLRSTPKARSSTIASS